MIFSAVGWSLLLCDFSATARSQKRNKILVSALRQRKRVANAHVNGKYGTLTQETTRRYNLNFFDVFMGFFWR